MNKWRHRFMSTATTKVSCTLRGKYRTGKVLRWNHKTTWVRIMIGAKTYIDIKRSNNRHHVRCLCHGEQI